MSRTIALLLPALLRRRRPERAEALAVFRAFAEAVERRLGRAADEAGRGR
jgi:hypothetical protein